MTTNAKSVPEWARKRAHDLMSNERNPVFNAALALETAFARYIAEHEEAPVEPEIVAAREVFAEAHDRNRYQLVGHGGVVLKCGAGIKEIMSGDFDHHPAMADIIAGVRRGIELAKAS